MDWNKWSGFVGNGTYIVINRGSLTALGSPPAALEAHSKIQGLQVLTPWSPSLVSQLRLTIKSQFPAPPRPDPIMAGTLTGTGYGGPLVALPVEERPAGPAEGQNPGQLWAIDRSILGTEEGKMVVWVAAVHYHLDRGDYANGTEVSLKPEAWKDEIREPQKWLLQIQHGYEDAFSSDSETGLKAAKRTVAKTFEGGDGD
ncbi:MAG: hypothetical protein Q9221_004721 [Calogaya cf. arnoldii]